MSLRTVHHAHRRCALPWALLVALACAGGAGAQKLESLSVLPNSAAVGEPVTLTAVFNISGGLNCSARAHFGDGRTQDFRVNQDKDARFVLTHRYEQPGSYTVRIEPKTQLPVLRCLGDEQRANLTITPAVRR